MKFVTTSKILLTAEQKFFQSQEERSYWLQLWIRHDMLAKFSKVITVSSFIWLVWKKFNDLLSMLRLLTETKFKEIF